MRKVRKRRESTFQTLDALIFSRKDNSAHILWQLFLRLKAKGRK
jgi:hypothetical protein